MAKEVAMVMHATKKQQCKAISIMKLPTQIYHRFMRYPLFPPTKSFYKKHKKVVHALDEHGEVIAIVQNVTVEDFEALAAALRLVIENKANKTDTKYITPIKGRETEITIVHVNLSDLKRKLNRHSYIDIWTSLVKISHIDIVYDFVTEKGKHEKIILKPIIQAIATQDNQIEIHFMKLFFDNCFQKCLRFDLDVLLKLPPIAKNVYLYLMANTDKEIFRLQTILSRCLLTSREFKEQKKDLKRALNALKKLKLLKNFEITKDRVKIQYNRKQVKSSSQIPKHGSN